MMQVKAALGHSRRLHQLYELQADGGQKWNVDLSPLQVLAPSKVSINVTGEAAGNAWRSVNFLGSPSRQKLSAIHNSRVFVVSLNAVRPWLFGENLLLDAEQT